MKYYSIYLRQLLLLCLVSIVTCSYAQVKDEETFEQVLYDIQTRNFERPIRLISNELSSMEQLPAAEFQDSIYIGLTNLLATAYVQNNQIDEADKLLSHAIKFFDGSSRRSPLVYALYSMYGFFFAALEDYSMARNYLEVTVEYLRDLGLLDEDLGVILSGLAVCHMKLNELNKAYDEIMESISIIENSSSRYTTANLIQVYEKAGTICHEICLSETNENTQKIFEHHLFNDAKTLLSH